MVAVVAAAVFSAARLIIGLVLVGRQHSTVVIVVIGVGIVVVRLWM